MIFEELCTRSGSYFFRSGHHDAQVCRRDYERAKRLSVGVSENVGVDRPCLRQYWLTQAAVDGLGVRGP